MPSVLLRAVPVQSEMAREWFRVDNRRQPGSLSPRPCCGALAHCSLFLYILYFAAILCQPDRQSKFPEPTKFQEPLYYLPTYGAFLCSFCKAALIVGEIAGSRTSIKSRSLHIVLPHSSIRWSAVSLPAPHSQPGEVTPGTLRLCRKALRPIFPVCIWTSSGTLMFLEAGVFGECCVAKVRVVGRFEVVACALLHRFT